MRALILSDIHGSAIAARQALSFFEKFNCDRLFLLGDTLYHGPRNPLPAGHGPMGVVEALEPYKGRITAVRGNCDAEVDQMMFKFPMMSDYAVLDAGTETFFLTHGHLWNEFRLPPIGMGTVLVHGHTHVPEQKKLKCGLTIFNPGSVSLPKGGSSCGFGYFDGTTLVRYCV